MFKIKAKQALHYGQKLLKRMMEVGKRVNESGQIMFQNLPRSNHFTIFSIFLRVLNFLLFHCSSSPRPAILLTGLSCSPTFSKSSQPSFLHALLNHPCLRSCHQASLAVSQHLPAQPLQKPLHRAPRPALF